MPLRSWCFVNFWWASGFPFTGNSLSLGFLTFVSKFHVTGSELLAEASARLNQGSSLREKRTGPNLHIPHSDKGRRACPDHSGMSLLGGGTKGKQAGRRERWTCSCLTPFSVRKNLWRHPFSRLAPLASKANCAPVWKRSKEQSKGRTASPSGAWKGAGSYEWKPGGGWKAWQHFLIDLLSESIAGATHTREDRLRTCLSSSPSKQSMCVAFFFTSIFTPDCWALPLKVATLNTTSRNVQGENARGEELTESGSCLGWAHGNTEISLTL